MTSVSSCSCRLLAQACTKKKSEQTTELNRISLLNHIELTINTNIEAAKDWDKMATNQSLFLQRSYLKALESCPPKTCSLLT